MLDRNTDILQIRPSVMSIGRKWVSDTNLSKFLHETIEKKQANKQSKLPDLSKDALLSATIKKISSAMMINRKLSCCENDEEHSMLCPKHGVNSDAKSCENHLNKGWGDEMVTPMTLDSAEIDDMDSEMLNMTVRSSSRTRSPLQRQSSCSSPKRKRQPSFEGMDDCSSFTNLETVGPNASPCKKRRDEYSKSRTADITVDDADFDLNWLDDKVENDDCFNDAQNGMKGQRSQSLPHLSYFTKENLGIPSKNEYNPSKSVVSSISELSIRDCLDTGKDSSWCFGSNDSTESDPLELNGFFQELKTVTVNPN